MRIELSASIAYEKFKEVIESSGFIILEGDSVNTEIFAKSNFKWLSGGENIYVRFEEDSKGTKMNFTSISPRINDFLQNHENYLKVMNEFEESLTI
jgi:hypothetical protein